MAESFVSILLNPILNYVRDMTKEKVVEKISEVAKHVAIKKAKNVAIDISKQNIAELEEKGHDSFELRMWEKAFSVLSDKMDKIQAGIDVLRTKDFETAVDFFQFGMTLKADRYLNFRKAFEKGLEAKNVLTDEVSKIKAYSIILLSGFYTHVTCRKNHSKEDAVNFVKLVVAKLTSDIHLMRYARKNATKNSLSRKEEEFFVEFFHFVLYIESFSIDLDNEEIRNMIFVVETVKPKRENFIAAEGVKAAVHIGWSVGGLVIYTIASVAKNYINPFKPLTVFVQGRENIDITRDSAKIFYNCRETHVQMCCIPSGEENVSDQQ